MHARVFVLISIQGTRRDCVVGIIRRFLNRFPLDLGDEEPDIRFLIDLDDDRPLPEPKVPAPEEMPELTVEQYAGMVEATIKLADDMKAKGAVSDRDSSVMASHVLTLFSSPTSKSPAGFAITTESGCPLQRQSSRKDRRTRTGVYCNSWSAMQVPSL